MDKNPHGDVFFFVGPLVDRVVPLPNGRTSWLMNGDDPNHLTGNPPSLGKGGFLAWWFIDGWFQAGENIPWCSTSC